MRCDERRWSGAYDIYRMNRSCLDSKVIDNLSLEQLSDPMKEATLQIIYKQLLATNVLIESIIGERI